MVLRRRSTSLDREDAARLWMSTRRNPMVVTAVLRLDGALDPRALEEIVRARLLAHDRFLQRVVIPLLPHTSPRWREVRALELDRHLSRVDLGAGAPESALADAASRFASEPLPLRRPLWRVRLVQRGAESALVVRVHHAIADGVALLGVLFSFSDEGAGARAPFAVAAGAPATGDGSLRARAATLVDLLRRPVDAPPALRGVLGRKKRLAWSGPLDLEALRRAAHVLGARVNDLVLGALAGAVRRYLQAGRGGAPPRPIHALVPVALPHEAGALGNHFASVFAELPVHLASPVARIEASRDAMRRARASAGVSLGRTLQSLGALGGPLERAGVWLLSRKASLVASNVAGPPSRLHVGGREVRSISFAAPAPGTVALSASAFGYAGELRVTFAADARVVPSPAELARGFEDEVRAAVAALRA